MIRCFPIIFLLLLIPLSFSLAFGSVDDFTTNKSLYYEGDTLYVSGTVSSELDSPNVTIVIFNPSKSTFVTLGSAIANSDGSFSATLLVGGPTWSTYGIYPIQVTSEGSSMEKSIEYKESSTPESPPETESSSESIPAPESEPTTAPESEPIPEQQITDLNELGIASFVDESKDPQHYVGRYYSETIYKKWFDDYYPQYSSIYEAVGLKALPLEIKIHAMEWATGEIDDSEFVTEIEFMLENNIIVISDIPTETSDNEIPAWVRNNALWWSQDLISEYEFVNSLKFLIQEGIILVN